MDFIDQVQIIKIDLDPNLVVKYPDPDRAKRSGSGSPTRNVACED
jgi:hypothetical protein